MDREDIVRRLVASCTTEVLLKVWRDPVRTSNPRMQKWNAFTRETIRQELVRRGALGDAETPRPQ